MVYLTLFVVNFDDYSVKEKRTSDDYASISIHVHSPIEHVNCCHRLGIKSRLSRTTFVQHDDDNDEDEKITVIYVRNGVNEDLT